MYRHIVMFWLKDSTEENIQMAAGKLRSLAGKIEGLLSVEVEADALHSERSCDLCLNMVFDSRASLDAYRTHPCHLPVQAHMHAVREKSCAADYPITQPVREMPRLYAAIGPTSREARVLQAMVGEGLGGIRISMQHYAREEALAIIQAYRAAAEAEGVAAEILLDDIEPGHVEALIAETGAAGLILPLTKSRGMLSDWRKLLGDAAQIIGKIDCAEDIAALPRMMPYTDALLVARAGMGRSAQSCEIPRMQKQVAAIAVGAGMRFILAEDLLASMLRHPFPSAAELCDVHNAVLDGASALMLDRVVSVGDYPVQAVKTLRQAMEAALLPTF